MNLSVLKAICLVAGPLCALAQNPQPSSEPVETPGPIQVEASWRGRAGVDALPGSASSSAYGMHRFRGSVRFEPLPWMEGVVQFQDSRGWSGDAGSYASWSNDPLDFRQVLIRFGVKEGPGWQAVVGRQEFSLGEERLIGADADWCNLGRPFDLVQASYTGERTSWRVFGGAAVNPERSRLDRVGRGGGLAGFSADLRLGGGLRLSPQWLFTQMASPAGPRRVSTSGTAFSLEMPRDARLAGEVHLQHGWATRAWALAATYEAPVRWEPFPVSLLAGYSVGSGGGAGSDGRQRTFHDLYPAGHNGAGLLDPYAWRNLHDLMWGLSWQLGPKWRLLAEDHSYWLASTADGLYVDGGDPLYFSSGSRYAGHQTNWTIERTLGRSHRIASGVAWLATGKFVREGGGPPHAATLFVSFERRF